MAVGPDIHFHLLPGVDDGPGDMSDSLELARLALADGTRRVVVTPHVRPDFLTDALSVRERVDEVAAALAAEGIRLELKAGAELGHQMAWRLDDEELDAVAQGPPGARWLLVEAPFVALDEEFHAATDELRARGFGVVIAHPERSADAELDASAGLRIELAAGSLAQVNGGSLLGRHGPAAEAAGLALVRGGLVAAVASDAHGQTRPPLLSLVRRLLSERGFVTSAEALTRTTPALLLERGLPAPARVAA